MGFYSFAYYISLFYLCLYIPFSFMVYSPAYYDFNFNTLSNIDYDILVVNQASNELPEFFMYKTNLDQDLWTKEEIIHYKEVREIFNVLFIIFLISISIILSNLILKRQINYVKNRYILIPFFILSLLVGIFFSLFWEYIHYILFDNMLWLMSSNQISFYLFPLEFFFYSFLFLFLTTNILFVLLNRILCGKKLNN